jgi:hypothetical protein
MRRMIVGTLSLAGLIVVMASIASASPGTPVLDRSATVRGTSVERVDYSWNRHRYRHRSWDKRHRRWRYYD